MAVPAWKQLQTDGPATKVVAVTPHDTNAIAGGPYRGISWVTAGTLRITDGEGNVVNFASGELAANVIHAIALTHVHSTGTTAGTIKVYK
jgi:hypothetical protein